MHSENTENINTDRAKTYPKAIEDPRGYLKSFNDYLEVNFLEINCYLKYTIMSHKK